MAPQRKWKCCQCGTIVTFEDLKSKNGGIVNKKVFCKPHFQELVKAAMRKTQTEHASKKVGRKSPPPAKPTQPPAAEAPPTPSHAGSGGSDEALELMEEEEPERPVSVPQKKYSGPAEDEHDEQENCDEQYIYRKRDSLRLKKTATILLCLVVMLLLAIIALLLMEQKGIFLFADKGSENVSATTDMRSGLGQKEPSSEEPVSEDSSEDNGEEPDKQSDEQGEPEHAPETADPENGVTTPDTDKNRDAYNTIIAEAGTHFDNTVKGFSQGKKHIEDNVLNSEVFKDTEYAERAREYIASREKEIDSIIKEKFSKIEQEVTALLEETMQIKALEKVESFPSEYRSFEKWEKRYDTLVRQIKSGAESKLKQWISYAQGEADKGRIESAISILEEIRDTTRGKVFKEITGKIEKNIRELKNKRK